MRKKPRRQLVNQAFEVDSFPFDWRLATRSEGGKRERPRLAAKYQKLRRHVALSLNEKKIRIEIYEKNVTRRAQRIGRP